MDGSITGSIDTAQVVLYMFWVFFACLIFYLRREDKREGYPLQSDRSGRVLVQGYPSIPDPKVFRLAHGQTVIAPNGKVDTRELAATPVAPWPGAPLQPTGNPMLACIGPGSYAEREDVPEHIADGRPCIVPLRVETESSVAEGEVDPRGMNVLGADKQVAGIVREIWTDRAEPQIRYLEVDVQGASGPQTVLLPMPFAKIDKSRRVINVRAILASQFADVPALRNPDVVTKLEEDKITAYYAAGTLYATPLRLGA